MYMGIIKVELWDLNILKNSKLTEVLTKCVPWTTCIRIIWHACYICRSFDLMTSEVYSKA